MDESPWQPRADNYLGGICVRSVGDDGRVTLPQAWNTLFGSTARMWDSPGDKLKVYGSSFWLQRARELDAQQRGFESDETARKFFSYTTPLPVDSQGRFVLPKDLRERRSIGKSVRLIGCGSHFEVEPAEGE